MRKLRKGKTVILPTLGGETRLAGTISVHGATKMRKIRSRKTQKAETRSQEIV